jgi:hypothetical protein
MRPPRRLTSVTGEWIDLILMGAGLVIIWAVMGWPI